MYINNFINAQIMVGEKERGYLHLGNCRLYVFDIFGFSDLHTFII